MSNKLNNVFLTKHEKQCAMQFNANPCRHKNRKLESAGSLGGIIYFLKFKN
jgi:hypothetical protein